jgi:hypothetical protein
MEVPQGNSLCRYLKQEKGHFLFFFFFFYKIREWECGTFPAWGVVVMGRKGEMAKEDE